MLLDNRRARNVRKLNLNSNLFPLIIRFDGADICSYNVVMKRLRIVWDPKKAAANLKKHGVSFEEAETAFHDENAIEFYDDEHSDWEDRFLLLGLSSRLRLLLVCHCYREDEELIRVVSARRATSVEANYYGK